MGVQACKSSTWEDCKFKTSLGYIQESCVKNITTTRHGGTSLQSQLHRRQRWEDSLAWKKVSKILSQNTSQECWYIPIVPANQEAEVGGSWLGAKARLYLKNKLKQKKKELECGLNSTALHSKHKVLSSNPSTA
jgi:hypothetical protein